MKDLMIIGAIAVIGTIGLVAMTFTYRSVNSQLSSVTLHKMREANCYVVTAMDSVSISCLPKTPRS